MVEALFRQPGPMRSAPMLAPLERSTMAQQEGEQMLTGPANLLDRRLSCSRQVAHRLVDGIGNPYRRQLPRPQQGRQRHRIPPIGLDLRARTDRDHGRRSDQAVVTEFDQLAVEPVAGGAGLVAEAEIRGARSRVNAHHLPQSVA